MDIFQGFANFYYIQVDLEEFWHLVFLDNSEVRQIVPLGEDRRLRAVTQRAINHLATDKLSSNWDLQEVYSQAKDTINPNEPNSFPDLVLRDLSGSEGQYQPAFKYIHDGCHRSLGYALRIQVDGISFFPIFAYLATNGNLRHR